MNVFFKYITPCTCVWISRRVCSVPWCTCVARRDPAHMSVHPRGGGTRAVCLAPGYRARQTYGLPLTTTIPPPPAAEPPRLTNMLTAADLPSLTNALSTAEPKTPSGVKAR